MLTPIEQQFINDMIERARESSAREVLERVSLSIAHQLENIASCDPHAQGASLFILQLVDRLKDDLRAAGVAVA